MSANIIEALKALTAKITSKSVTSIPGDDKCEVLDYLTENYAPPSAGSTMTGTAQSLTALDAPESADAATIATKVNEIIAQLKARGVSL